MNHIIISGRLGRDAERKQVGSSEKLRFSVAVSERYKDRSGELVEKTHWVDVDVFGDKWIDFGPRLTKGSEVVVTGEIRVNKSEDGRVWTTVFAREIVVGAPPKRREDDDPFAAPAPAPAKRRPDPEDWDR